MSASPSFEFRIFDIAFSLRAERDAQLTIAHSFMDAYAPADSSFSASRPARLINFEIRTVDAIGSDLTMPMDIHRTKHPYWNLSGSRDASGHRFLWPTRGLALECDAAAEQWVVSVQRGTDDLLAGEAAFHALRGVALYNRPVGNLLHAAAVVSQRRVVAFAGAAMSGKTSLMTAMVRKPGWSPFTNDRLLVIDGDRLTAGSWPSYASYCEGFLLRDPILSSAAKAYELDDCPYRTRRWGADLHDEFDKTRKRSYPMIWQAKAWGRRFESTGDLAALVFCRLDPALRRASFVRLAPSDPAIAEQLAVCAFDVDEPSFLPWHGLKVPTNVPSPDTLSARLAAQGVSVFVLSAPPDQISGPLRELEVNLGRRVVPHDV